MYTIIETLAHICIGSEKKRNEQEVNMLELQEVYETRMLQMKVWRKDHQNNSLLITMQFTFQVQCAIVLNSKVQDEPTI